MNQEMNPLTAARELAAIAQTGAHFATDRYDQERYHVYKMFFNCELVGGGPKGTEECSESAFFAEGGLPELSVSRVLAGQLHGFFAAVRSGKSETRYD